MKICASLAVVALTATLGCHGPERIGGPTEPSWAVLITGYDVPKPETVPYEGTEASEYLRFYHAGYLEFMNSSGWYRTDCIIPRSPHADAALSGFKDGEAAAREAKAAYWERAGRTLPMFW